MTAQGLIGGDPFTVPFSRYARHHVYRVVFTWELIVTIDEGYIVPMADLDPLFQFMHRPDEATWYEARQYVLDPKYPLQAWRPKMQEAEERDRQAQGILTTVGSKLKRLARREVVARCYGSSITPKTYVYTVPGLVSREAFIAIFLFSRYNEYAPLGSLPHFYIENNRKELRGWKGSVENVLYVVMSRGYFQVDWTTAGNDPIEGRLIFSRNRVHHLKDRGGRIFALNPPPSRVSLFKYPEMQMEGSFENLTEVMEKIWETDGDIDGKWTLQCHHSGVPNWPESWSDKPLGWNRRVLPLLPGEYAKPSPEGDDENNDDDEEDKDGEDGNFFPFHRSHSGASVVSVATSQFSRPQTFASAETLVPSGTVDIYSVHTATPSIAIIQIKGDIKSLSSPLKTLQIITLDTPASVPNVTWSPNAAAEVESVYTATDHTPLLERGPTKQGFFGEIFDVDTKQQNDPKYLFPETKESMGRHPYPGARTQGSRRPDIRDGIGKESGSERTCSIFDAILGQGHQSAKEREGASILIRCLLEVALNTVLEAHVNILTTFAFIRAAQQECVRLENAMNSTLGQETPSVSFERFKQAISRMLQLEEILLENWDHTIDSNIFESKSVLECRQSINSWEQHRRMVVDKLLRISKLSGGPRPIDPDTLWEARTDDALILRTMVEDIQWDAIIIDEKLNQSRTILRSLMGLVERAPPVLDRKRTTYAIKAASFIRAAIEESGNVNTRNVRRAYLQGPDVWAATLDLVSSIARGNIAEVERKYQTFVDKLLHTDSSLSDQSRG